ncbi:small GTPase superfamily [Obelidium mucronatum]|nr:small GTPase superfamily [Obelidium mucronatum]
MQQTAQHNIVVLGDGAVGKTALTTQYCLNNFPEAYDPTIVDSYRKKVLVDGEECILEILDTAGQDEFLGMRDQWFRFGDGFILVYSITSRQSFNYIKEYHKEMMRAREIGAAPTPILIVGNKTDLAGEREVSTQEGMDLAKLFKSDFLETSAKTKYNVENTFHSVVRMLRKQQSVRSSKPECCIM